MNLKKKPKNYGQITGIIFSSLESSLVDEVSHVEVNKSTLTQRKLPTDHGADDLRLGSNNPNLSCKTCGYGPKRCPGHWGHIDLAVPAFHPDKIKPLLKVLKLHCFSCGKPLLPLELLPESDTRSKSWNQKAKQINLKYARIMQQYIGYERVCALTQLLHKKLLSCGVPTQEIESDQESSTSTVGENPERSTDKACFAPELITHIQTYVKGKKNNKSQKYLSFGEPQAITTSARNSETFMKKKVEHGDPRLKKRRKVTTKRQRRLLEEEEEPEADLPMTPLTVSSNEMEIEQGDDNCAMLSTEEMLRWTETLMCQSSRCGLYQPDWINCKIYIKPNFGYLQNKGLTSPIYYQNINSKAIYRTLCSISDDHVRQIGLDPSKAHPRSFMVKSLPVAPVCIRSRDHREDDNVRGQDDITYALSQIVKVNESLRQALKDQRTQKKPPVEGADDSDLELDFDLENDSTTDEEAAADLRVKKQARQMCIDAEITKVIKRSKSRKAIFTIRDRELLLIWNVACMFNNHLPGVPRLRFRTQDAVRCFNSRLPSKRGLFREVLLGKRNNQSARNVVNGDGYQHLNQVTIPRKHAEVLYLKERVVKSNLKFLTSLLRNGRTHPGVIAVVRGEKRYDTRIMDFSKFKLQEGDLVYRHIIDDDQALMNRQPSLHRGSLEIHRIKVANTPTFNINHSVCPPYGADFDGDEFNLNPIQKYSTGAESMLAGVDHQILSARHGRALAGFIQDSVLGAWLLSDPALRVPTHLAMQFLVEAYCVKDIDRLRVHLPRLQTLSWSHLHAQGQTEFGQTTFAQTDFAGPSLIEWLLPQTLYLKTKTMLIRHGQIVSGRLGNEELKHLVHAMVQQYGDHVAADFITVGTRAFEWFLFYRGTTVALGHFENPCPEITHQILQDTMQKTNQIVSLARTQGFQDSVLPPFVEEGIHTILDHARAQGCRQMLQRFDQPCAVRHGPREMTLAKSKGSESNLTQITAFLGQQNLNGRMQKSLSIFSEMEKELRNIETQGMVTTGFHYGLSPTHYIWHSMCGRSGIVDTTIKTQDSGYLNRKMDKGTESLSTSVDGSTRSADGHLVEWRFGDDNFNPQFVEWVPLRILDYTPEEMSLHYEHLDLDLKKNSQMICNEYRKLQGYRATIRKVRNRLNAYQWVSSLSSPVNFEVLFTKMGVGTTPYRVLEPEEVIQMVDAAVTEWIQSNILCLTWETFAPQYWIRKHVFPFDAPENSIPFLAYVHDWFSSKQIVHVWRWSPAQLKRALKWTEQYLMRGRMGIFQQVGSIASQSVTEPTTQMTLTTFYTAGLKQGAAQDLRRMYEIVNALPTEKMVYPTMQLSVRPEFCYCVQQTELEVATTLSHRLPGIWLKDLLDPSQEHVEIVHAKDGVWEEDRSLFEDYANLLGMASVKPHPAPQMDFQWSLRFLLHRSLCIERGLTPEAIVLRMMELDFHPEQHTNFLCSHPLETRWVIYMQCAMPIAQTESYLSASRAKLWLLAERMLTTLLIDGLHSIKSATVTEKTMYTVDKQQHKKVVVDTCGSDLGSLWQFPEVAWESSRSNSIHDVRQELGLDAAQVNIYNQNGEVLAHNGLPVDGRHINIIASMMVHHGTIYPFTRFGIVNKSPLEKITFEEPLPNILDAVLNGKEEPLHGIVENITIGNPLPMGINRLPKPLNIDFTSHDDIQDRLHLLALKRNKEARCTPRVWPKITPAVARELQQLRLEAQASMPTPETLTRFLTARISDQSSDLLKFSSTVFGKWRIASYEYILSEMKYMPRTYSFQRRDIVVAVPMAEAVAEVAPSVPPSFLPSSASWSFRPSFVPSTANFDRTNPTRKQTVLPFGPFVPSSVVEWRHGNSGNYLDQIPECLGWS